MKLYCVKINWYDDYNSKDNVDKAFIFAESYSKAIEQLDILFSYINEIKIEEVCSDTGGTCVLFMPNNKEMINEIRNRNSY